MGACCSCFQKDSLKPTYISGSNVKTPLDVSILLSKNHDDNDSTYSLSPIQTPLLTSINFGVTREDDEISDSVDDEEIEQLLNEEDKKDE